MKTSKRLLGTAGFSIAAAALFMGAGTASADGPTASDIVICGDGCVIQHGPTTAFQKISNVILFKFGDRPVANKLSSVLQKLDWVMEKG